MKYSKSILTPKKSSKKNLKKIRFYPIFMYHKLDNWLSEMSLNGWHIVHCGVFVFYFEHGKPTQKKYFTYAEFSQEVKYSLTLKHPFFKKRYGLNSSQSKINSNQSKKHQILEIDLKKVDIQNDICFNELVNDRNRLYRCYCLRNIVLVVLLSVFIVLFNMFLLWIETWGCFWVFGQSLKTTNDSPRIDHAHARPCAENGNPV